MRTIPKAAIVVAVLGLMAPSNPALAENHYSHHRYWHRYWGSPYGYTYRQYNPDLHCTLAAAARQAGSRKAGSASLIAVTEFAGDIANLPELLRKE